MKDEQKEAFAKMLAKVFSLHDKEFSADALDVWWAATRQYSLSDFGHALLAQVRTPRDGKFLPKPADIVEAIEGAIPDRIAIAWSKILVAIEKCGRYKSFSFDDPVIGPALEAMGGIDLIGHTPTADLGFRRHEFAAAYKAAMANPRGTQFFIGLHDADRMRRGIHSIEVAMSGGEYDMGRGQIGYHPGAVLIGDQERAKQVMLGRHDQAVEIGLAGELNKILIANAPQSSQEREI